MDVVARELCCALREQDRAPQLGLSRVLRQDEVAGAERADQLLSRAIRCLL